MLLHTDAFTRKPFYTQKLSPQFLTLDHHFARKGCASTSEIAISPQFLAIEARFARKDCDRHFEIANLPQFLAIEARFLRKGSFRAVSLALPHALREKSKRRKKKRVREQEGKRARGQERM